MPVASTSALAWRLAADAVLFLHFGYVLFVVVGLLLIVIGGALRWQWVHNPFFRALHLLAIGIVVIQAWFGMVCPLTLLENSLRARALDVPYPGDFIAWWTHRLLFWQAPPAVFTTLYSGFAMLVVASWIWVRPRRSSNRAKPFETRPGVLR